MGYRLSKHKMTRYSKNWGEHGPLSPPGYAYDQRHSWAAPVLTVRSPIPDHGIEGQRVNGSRGQCDTNTALISSARKRHFQACGQFQSYRTNNTEQMQLGTNVQR